MSNIKVVDITGKKAFNCVNCSHHIPAPKRTLNRETLRHMKEAETLAKHLEKDTEKPAITNAILCLCPKCGQPHLLTDQFSKQTRTKKSHQKDQG